MPKALVIGAGPAGTASGLALQRAGWDVAICEAYSASASLDQGAFLTVARNGLDALEAIGVADAVRDLGFVTRRMHFTSGTGKALGSMPLGPGVGGASPRTVLRTNLYTALLDRAVAAGIAVHHDRRLVDATGLRHGADTSPSNATASPPGATTSPNGITATFADGSTEHADLLVGADGLRSRVRELIDPGAPTPEPTGLGNVGAIATSVPDVDLSAAAADGEYRMVWGRRCFFGYAVDPSGEVWWFANPPERRDGAAHTLESVAQLLDDDASPAAAIVRATTAPVLAGRQLALPRVPTWQRDRMVLVGDAAHAVSPATGQGVSLAWEDAALLGLHLAREPDPSVAIAAYVAARRERVDRIVKWGQRMGGAKAAGPVGRRIRDAMFPLVTRLASRESAMRKQAWLHEHHVDWADTARDLTH
ncbi:MAG: NAD(P)/FAD-dependent oxidoreductase [Solirubrobacteraceae bacterium]|nr:NAD(P)/FAD-dependent oxidoreductase [Solirubrobacteraceae bacterium]